MPLELGKPCLQESSYLLNTTREVLSDESKAKPLKNRTVNVRRNQYMMTNYNGEKQRHRDQINGRILTKQMDKRFQVTAILLGSTVKGNGSRFLRFLATTTREMRSTTNALDSPQNGAGDNREVERDKGVIIKTMPARTLSLEQRKIREGYRITFKEKMRDQQDERRRTGYPEDITSSMTCHWTELDFSVGRMQEMSGSSMGRTRDYGANAPEFHIRPPPWTPLNDTKKYVSWNEFYHHE